MRELLLQLFHFFIVRKIIIITGEFLKTIIWMFTVQSFKAIWSLPGDLHVYLLGPATVEMATILNQSRSLDECN